MKIALTGYNPLSDILEKSNNTSEESVSFTLSALNKAGILMETRKEETIVLGLLAETFTEYFAQRNTE